MSEESIRYEELAPGFAFDFISPVDIFYEDNGGFCRARTKGPFTVVQREDEKVTVSYPYNGKERETWFPRKCFA